MPIDAKRLYLVHLQSGDAVSAQFNPVEFRETIETLWNEVGIPGESHEPAEYDHTKNLVAKFDLAFDTESENTISFGGSLFKSSSDIEDGMKARRFLMALPYTMRDNGQSAKVAAPSKVLVVWPGFYSLPMRLKKIEIVHKEWSATDGPPVLFVVSLEFFADSIKRINYEDVREHGTIRSGG